MTTLAPQTALAALETFVRLAGLNYSKAAQYISHGADGESAHLATLDDAWVVFMFDRAGALSKRDGKGWIFLDRDLDGAVAERERDELLAACEGYSRAFDAIFAHGLSNGVFNAWRVAMDCTSLNQAQEAGKAAIAKVGQAVRVDSRRDLVAACEAMLARCEAQTKLLAAYRVGRPPAEKVLNELAKTNDAPAQAAAAIAKAKGGAR